MQHNVGVRIEDGSAPALVVAFVTPSHTILIHGRVRSEVPAIDYNE